MRSSAWIALLAHVSFRLVLAKAVFAHFMVGNVKNWEIANWVADMKLAQQAHIDAFALNIAAQEDYNLQSIGKAFAAAESIGFQLFFSFDYAGNGAFDKDVVIKYINQFAPSVAHWKVNGQPLVSTFEGPGNAIDWYAIKAATECFFLPDWSSAGAKGALLLNAGSVDGLMSWAAWPWGNLDMNTYVDASYLDYLGIFSFSNKLQYLMPVSPWFYTNLPGYKKNWLWRSEDLWYDRWQEVWVVQPEFVEILTWNDYGESHYIGPLHDEEMEAFTIGKAPFNYVTNMPHDAWRVHLPYIIDMYKKGTATITKQSLVAWYRLTPRGACADGGTTGNTASQLQVEFYPLDIIQDKIFYSALLGQNSVVSVTVGGVDLGATWSSVPDGNIGMYHGSVAYGANVGKVVITIGSSVKYITLNGESITTSCTRATGQNGLTNWNPWVGSAADAATVNFTPALALSKQVCIKGTGAPAYEGLCSFSCALGYCPIGACTCLMMGKQKVRPTQTNIVGYPAAGKSATYSGLCAFACGYGYCPSTACDTVQHALVVPTVSPFLPAACIAGTGVGNLAGLCSYSCNYGFCPIHSCKCIAQGGLNVPPAETGARGGAAPGLDPFIYDAICDFACSRGYCPAGVCSPRGSDSGTGDFLVYAPPSIWVNPAPIVQLGCYPPCTFILPPFTLAAPTTIYFEPYVTTLEVFIVTTTTITTYTDTAAGTTYISTLTKGTTSSTGTTIIVPSLTTDVISFWNINIDPEDDENQSLIIITTSISPPVVTITATSSGTTYQRTIHPPPWPYVDPPQPTKSTTGPPAYISWTKSAAGPPCTAGVNCGKRCVGLFCKFPCLLTCPPKFPDPDWWDIKDPNTPWPPGSPWVPEDEVCTTTSASSCSTECLAATPTSTCKSSCSISYGCSATDTSTLGTFTLAPYGYMIRDSFNTASDDNSAFTSSVYLELSAELASIYGTTPTPPVIVSTVTLPDTTVTVTPTPVPVCTFYDAIVAYQVVINNIWGWAADGGTALKKEENGCGAVTEWTWSTNGEFSRVQFNIPITLKAGCIERAIVSAGGPSINCDGGGFGNLKRSVDKDNGNAHAEAFLDTSLEAAPQPLEPLILEEGVLEGGGSVKLWNTPSPSNETAESFHMNDLPYPMIPVAELTFSNLSIATNTSSLINATHNTDGAAATPRSVLRHSYAHRRGI